MRKPNKKERQFLEAYDKYADAIYRHCFFRIFSKSRAEELVQEVFTKSWEYILEGKRIENFRAFLYRVANNLIIDESRKRKENSLDQLLEDSPASEPSCDGRKDLEYGEVLREIRARMGDLPQEDKEVLVMRYIDDLDPKEISEILGISANNVSVKINRAMKYLKEDFNKK